MSSLIPERQLLICPALAATIGLEEALLLQLLKDVCQLRPARAWQELSAQELALLLPFWSATDCHRVAHSLQEKGILTLGRSNQQSLRFSLDSSSGGDQATTTANSPPIQANTADQRRAKPLPSLWAADEELVQLLALNHNIPRQFSLQQQQAFALYWQERGEISHSWSNKFRQWVLKEWRHQQSQQSASDASDTIESQWRPSPDAIEILQRSGVSPAFMEDAVPEFVLYWRERGVESNTWNSKFIAHIRRQWAKFTATLELDYEPRQIPDNWQPSEDVYDILRLANIEIDFARQLVPEFVLFWRDTKEIQRSWNTKFLQHAKYQWATRHHMETHNAGQPANHRSGQAATNSPFQRLTDRSWADGLVEGG